MDDDGAVDAGGEAEQPGPLDQAGRNWKATRSVHEEAFQSRGGRLSGWLDESIGLLVAAVIVLAIVAAVVHAIW